MLENEKELYNKVTLALCDNIELPDAVLNCYTLLAEVMPITGITLGRTIPDETSTFVVIYKSKILSRFRKDPHNNETADYYKKASQDNADRTKGIEIADKTHFTACLCASLSKNLSTSIPFSPSFFFRISHSHNLTGGVLFHFDKENPLLEEHKNFLFSLRTPLALVMNNAIQALGLEQFDFQKHLDYAILGKELSSPLHTEIIGRKKGLKDIFKKIESVAALDINILITGETGTGKERIANAIHDFSDRKEKPFIAVNCGAIPTSLIDSELFGHAKGAFTGALSAKKGYFERAHTGTLFLDEIGELPFEVQARLLRVLQDGIVNPIGSEKEIQLDFRFLSATNNDLRTKVEEGLFREDLYFRLCELELALPPLRKRKSDIEDLVCYFITYYTKLFKMQDITIPAQEMQRLVDHNWPGNIRELQNTIKASLATMSDGKFCALLPSESKSHSAKVKNKLTTFDEMQKEYFTQLLFETDGKISGKGSASEIAQIDPNTLRSKLKKLGIKFRKGE